MTALPVANIGTWWKADISTSVARLPNVTDMRSTMFSRFAIPLLQRSVEAVNSFCRVEVVPPVWTVWRRS